MPLVARLTAELTTWKPTLLFHEGDISYARCACSRAQSSTSLSDHVCDGVPSRTRRYPCPSRQPRSLGYTQYVLFPCMQECLHELTARSSLQIAVVKVIQGLLCGY